MTVMNCDSKSVSIRLAKAEDVPHVEEIIRFAYRGGKETASWTNEYALVKEPRITERQLHDILAGEDQALLVAELEVDSKLRLAGCVRVDKLADGQAYFALFAVDPDLQSSGVGKSLFRAAEDFVVSQWGCRQIKMSVLSVRDDLIAWYNRMGFEETGEIEPFLPAESGVTPLVENLYFRIFSKLLI